MTGLLDGLAAEMRALPWPGRKPTGDRPVLRAIDLVEASRVRTADGTFEVLQVGESSVRVRKSWGWVDVPFGDVLGVTL